MTRQNLLIVYPHDFYERNSGINTRYYELMKYFTSRSFCVDQLGLTNFESKWEKAGVKERLMINNLFLYDFAKGHKEETAKNKVRNKISGMIKKRNPALIYQELPDFAFKSMQKQFNEIISAKHYDYIIISYLYWGNLITPEVVKNAINTEIILEISDFLAVNLFEQTEGKIAIGNLLGEEIQRARLFKKIICISEDEKFFFSQFIPDAEFYYVPFFIEDHTNIVRTNPQYDLVLVASDNPHNKKGIKWFFDHVYPLLSKSIKIFIGGKITSHIGKYDNVTTEYFVEDINALYAKSKVLICPLLGGTGIKIKVIEALSYGLPVVTTSKGIVGFQSKTSNGCLIAYDPKSFAQHINELLENNMLYCKQAEEAKKYFITNFERNFNFQMLDKIFLVKSN